MNIHGLFKLSEKFVVDNSTTIFTGIAVAGTATTAYLAAKGAFKSSLALMEEDAKRTAKDPKAVPLTRGEVLKLTWPNYLPAVTSGAVTVGAIICAHRISAARVAAMSTAYSLSEKKLQSYKERIEEKFGLEGKREVDKEVERKAASKARYAETIILGGEDVLCFDAYSGRYFRSSQEALRGAANDTNFEVIHSHYATLQFFWDLIGLEGTAYSDEFGWTADCPLELQFSTTMSSDDRPCMVVNYDVESIRRWNHM